MNRGSYLYCTLVTRNHATNVCLLTVNVMYFILFILFYLTDGHFISNRTQRKPVQWTSYSGEVGVNLNIILKCFGLGHYSSVRIILQSWATWASAEEFWICVLGNLKCGQAWQVWFHKRVCT